MSPPAGARPIFLVGFMGCGKTTVGRRLSEALGWRFVDTDQAVEAREGRSIATLFDVEGEGFFRRVEWEVLRGLDGTERLVVATGGGLFLGAEARRFIGRRGRSVWLDVPLAECRRRVGSADGRPLWLPGDPLDLRALFDRRRTTYALASIRVPAAGGPDETVRDILERLGPFSSDSR